ncbi:MAG: 4-diphosphocytidyl-2-C-methyl-D-erythritol kinase [Lentisphaerae bacterium ADurb.Bin242]|nr:MAG: 4-diphosphocytidyl-2-C-methyl-D-erythritol kinase [Lentisphaerae bacterium ADurb.Bin242]
MTILSLSTPGKINLYLEVKGKRPDSYHELVTLFYPVRAISDRVELELTFSGVTVSCETSGVPQNDLNICARAAHAYFEAARIDSGVAIRIEKTIPVAAGMGGGSSDAGATLLLLQRQFQALDAGALKAVALEIGADVPFFLAPEPAIGCGRGELLTPVELPAEPPLLIVPACFPVSSAWAYKHLVIPEKTFPASPFPLIEALRKGDFAEAQGLLRNDLQHAVLGKFPLLSLISGLLRETGGAVLVSGSGPTLFALYSDFRTRDDAFAALTPLLRKYHLQPYQS